MALGRSASWQAEVRRLCHLEVVGDEEVTRCNGGLSGGDGGAAATPPTAPPRGSSRAALLEQRKKPEVQDAAVVGSLVKLVYAEAWTTRAGAAMSSGYGKQVLKKKLCHIGGGDKPDGFDPSACQTHRDVDQFLIEPYRTTADMRWGFHQVFLSERAQRIFTFVAPFGTFAYQRLVMGYVNATAEFQRHVNSTLGVRTSVVGHMSQHGGWLVHCFRDKTGTYIESM